MSGAQARAVPKTRWNAVRPVIGSSGFSGSLGAGGADSVQATVAIANRTDAAVKICLFTST
jgi:hypothetical protein